MLRVSSHRRYVVGTFAGQSSEDVSNTYNVTNFKDYGLLQVFYPTRGYWSGTTARQASAMECPSTRAKAE